MNTDPIEESRTIRGGIRDKNATHHWKVLNNNFSLCTPPKKIIIFPGSASISSRQSNALCKEAEALLASCPTPYELCGFYYSNSNNRPKLVIQRAEELLNYFIPLIADKDKLGDLHRLPADKAAKNMHNVVVFTHCYGSRIINAVDKQLSMLMAEIGYSEEEIKNINRQLFVAHHNTPVEELGIEYSNFSNIYRITQADENNNAVKYSLNSLPYYILTEKMADDEVLVAPISENEQALIVQQVSKGGESEHNGAYWEKTRGKTLAGQQEEIMFKAIFNEAVAAKYPLQNVAQVVDKALKNSSDIKIDYAKMQQYGQEFIDDYKEYVAEISEEYNTAKNKVLKHRLSTDDIENLSEEALFLTDDKFKNLFDYAVKQDDYETAEKLWQKMLLSFPPIEHGKDLRETYKEYSRDFYEAQYCYYEYVQHALNNDDVKLFQAIVQNNDVLPYLDYSSAEDKTALMAGAMYAKIDAKKENMSEDIYVNGLLAVAKRCKQTAPDGNSRKVNKSLDAKISALGINREKIALFKSQNTDSR